VVADDAQNAEHSVSNQDFFLFCNWWSCCYYKCCCCCSCRCCWLWMLYKLQLLVNDVALETCKQVVMKLSNHYLHTCLD